MLAPTAPTCAEFDPEKQDLNVGEEVDASVWDAAPEIDEAPAPVAAPRRLAMRSDIELGKKYAGKRTTRERFLEVSPEDASDGEASEGEEEEDGEESESGEQEEGESEEESNSEAVQTEIETSSHLHQGASSLQQPWEAAVQEADKLQAELEREEQNAAPAVVAPSEDDPLKAEHTKNQRVRLAPLARK